MDFKIIFCDRQGEFGQYHEKYLKQFKDTSYYCGDFTELDGKFDCIVSPGNGFAIFDGGIDYGINRYFSEIEQFIVEMQKQLLDKCGGYQQPGSCTLFQTNVLKCPHLAHCPTMSVPLIVTDYSIIYHALWNLLIEVHKYNRMNPSNKIKTILCPGLGTGCGQVKPEYFFQLAQLAISDYLDYLKGTSSTNPIYLITWDTANSRYRKLYKLVESFDKPNEYDMNDMYDVMNLRKLRM